MYSESPQNSSIAARQICFAGISAHREQHASNALMRRPGPPREPTRTGESLSTNWSGHAVLGERFTSASGSWRVPEVRHSSGSTVRQVSSTWVGIGGVDGDETLIQLGTLQEVDTQGNPSYSAWYEILPAASVPIPGFPVHPGDLIEASLSCAPTSLPFTKQKWILKPVNVTRSQTWKLDITYKSSLLTAEWIMEASTFDGKISTLPDYGEVVFSHARANNKNPHVALSRTGITMVDDANHRISCPSNASGGDTFRVAFGNKTPAVPSLFHFKTFMVNEQHESFFEDVNDSVVVAGWYGGLDWIWGFTDTLGVRPPQILSYSKEATRTYPKGINSKNELVGFATLQGWPIKSVSFLYDSSAFHEIAVLTKIAAMPIALNDARDVVGWFADSSSGTQLLRGFLYRRGVVSLLDHPSAKGKTMCYGINNLGHIVGLYQTDVYTRGFLKTEQGFSDIHYPESSYTRAAAINDRGDIAGIYSDISGSHGFLRMKNGVYLPVDAPVGDYTEITGLNNQGHMVGWCTTPKGRGGFLAYDPDSLKFD